MKKLILLLIFAIQGGIMAETKKSIPAVAYFAGGCFWHMQDVFQKVPGATEVVAGYAQGAGAAPTYQDYAQKGYVEAVKVIYDPQQISYKNLVDFFWQQIDPTDTGGQSSDRGKQYRTGIYYETTQEKELAQASKDALTASGKFNKPIATEIEAFINFFPAEEYHQNYHAKKQALAIESDKKLESEHEPMKKPSPEEPSSGAQPHAQFVKPSEDVLRTSLTPLQFDVTQKNGTEAPFKNEYADNKEPGIYVDIVSGEPVFSSLDKYNSGTGWPSFTKPLEPNNIVEREDKDALTTRTEVRSKHGNSHLGHVFHDGPPPTGLRYCLNSAALKFIPVADLERLGYGNYVHLFEQK